MLNKFILLLTLLCISNTTLYAATVDQNYADAVASYEKLKEDKNKRTYRHNWIELSDRFWQLYQDNKKWNNRVAALYKSAEALEQMAGYSFVDRDAHDSSVRYEQLAKNHPNSNLADDALYAAANLRSNRLKDPNYALKLLALLDKNYSQGDMRGKSQELQDKINSPKNTNNPKVETAALTSSEKQKVEPTTLASSEKQKIEPVASASLESSESSEKKNNLVSTQITSQKSETVKIEANKSEPSETTKILSEKPKSQVEKPKPTTPKTTETKDNKSSNSKPILQSLSWDLNNSVSKLDIVIDKLIDWNVVFVPAKGNIPDRLIIELLGVQAAPKSVGGYLGKGDYALRQPITKVMVDYGTGAKTRIVVDCPNIKRYDINLTGFPYRLTLEVSKNAKDLAKGYTPGKDKPKNDLSKLDELTKLPIDVLAEQLSLQITSVVLDAGHGGRDPGAINGGITEKELVLDLVKLIGKKLEKNKIKVYYTRSDDSHISLSERAKIANDFKADIFISIHVNANDNSTVQGFESYYLDIANSSESAMLALKENNNERSQGQMNEVLADLMIGLRTYESKILAQKIHNKTLAKIKANKYATLDGKLKGAPFYVLMGISMPGVLIETGYGTNANEAKRLKNKKYHDTLAQGITDGIMDYIKTHNK